MPKVAKPESVWFDLSNNRRQVALTLSDSYCVDRHRSSFLALVRDGVDVLFVNEAELLSMYQTTSFADAMAAVAKIGTLTEIPAEVVDEVVDTTEARDLCAARFLSGLARNKPVAECARPGHVAATETISLIGARPQMEFKSLIHVLRNGCKRTKWTFDQRWI